MALGFFKKLWSGIKNTGKKIWEGVKRFVGVAAPIAREVGNVLQQSGNGTAQSIGSVLSQAADNPITSWITGQQSLGKGRLTSGSSRVDPVRRGVRG